MMRPLPPAEDDAGAREERLTAGDIGIVAGKVAKVVALDLHRPLGDAVDRSSHTW